MRALRFEPSSSEAPRDNVEALAETARRASPAGASNPFLSTIILRSLLNNKYN